MTPVTKALLRKGGEESMTTLGILLIVIGVICLLADKK